jgi:hypothetical protein
MEIRLMQGMNDKVGSVRKNKIFILKKKIIELKKNVFLALPLSPSDNKQTESRV